jgi:F0F1-type ATP synthase membrane subunit b/b'
MSNLAEEHLKQKLRNDVIDTVKAYHAAAPTNSAPAFIIACAIQHLAIEVGEAGASASEGLHNIAHKVENAIEGGLNDASVYLAKQMSEDATASAIMDGMDKVADAIACIERGLDTVAGSIKQEVK